MKAILIALMSWIQGICTPTLSYTPPLPPCDSYLTLHNYWQQPKEYKQSRDAILAKIVSLCPTTSHLLFGMDKACKQSLTTILERYKEAYPNAEYALPAFNPALEKEYESHAKGFRVLYTSEQPQFYAAHYIDTQCLALYQECVKHNPCNLDDIIILRQPCPHQPIEDRETQHQKRLEYLEHGTQRKSDNSACNQRYLLSCNPSLLSNIHNWAECTFRYMLQKHRARTGDAVLLPLDTIFDQYVEIAQLLKEYEAEFQHAIDTLVTSTTSGILLQLIFKSDDLFKDCTYSARAGGRKSSVDINGESIDDPLIILNTYYTHPTTIINLNDIQFRLILTSDLLLDITNPAINRALEIHAYCLDKALNSFHTTIQELMITIKEQYLLL